MAGISQLVIDDYPVGGIDASQRIGAVKIGGRFIQLTGAVGQHGICRLIQDEVAAYFSVLPEQAKVIQYPEPSSGGGGDQVAVPYCQVRNGYYRQVEAALGNIAGRRRDQVDGV